MFILLLLLLCNPVAIPRLNGYYGAGDGLIALDGLRCSGNEASLTDCRSREVPVQSSHVSDAGVYCYNSDNINGIHTSELYYIVLCCNTDIVATHIY